MTELERLLAGCLRWADGIEDADMDGLLVVADWLEENGRSADAEAVRHVHGRDLAMDAAYSGSVMGWYRVDSGWVMILTPQWASGRSSLRSLYANVEKVDRRGVSPTRIPISGKALDGSGQIAVYGRSGEEAIRSIVIVAFMSEGEMAITHEGETLMVQMTDPVIRSYLEHVCDGQPRVVAEAVRTLRKRQGRHGERLMKIMRNYPPLAEFSRQVRYELDGTVEAV